MFNKKSFIGILVIVLTMMLIVGCSEIAPNISLELEKKKPDSMPQQALDNQQATANVPDHAQANLPFGEEGGEAVPISIVLSWGTYMGDSTSYNICFQTSLIDPNGVTTTAEDFGWGESGEDKTVTTVVDTFIPGTYYYFVKTMSNYGDVTYTDMSSCEVNVYDTTINSLLATFDVTDATVDLESVGIPENSLTWKVFTFDGSTGEITPVNELNTTYAIPW